MSDGNGYEGKRLAVFRRREAAAGTLDVGLSATLFRRVEDLERDKYNAAFVATIRRAAEMVQAWEMYDTASEAGAAEQAYVEVLCDNRRLRATLLKLGARIYGLPIARDLKAAILSAIGNTLRAVKEPGAGRVLLGIEIGAKETEDEVNEKCRGAVAQYFAALKAANQGGERGGTSEQAGSGGNQGQETGDPAGDRKDDGDDPRGTT